jgi:hypothetical protein
MRIANYVLNTEAARLADERFVSEPIVKESMGCGPFKIPLNAKSGHLRKLWMDLYISFGGNFESIGNIRVASPLTVSSRSSSNAADEIFHRNHPELNGRRLDLSPNDKSLRKEWMDLYVTYGGRVAEIF